MKALVLAAVGAAAATSSCAVWVEGSFDDVTFAPSATSVAILDAHDILVRDGALVPVERPDDAKKIHLWLSAADLPEDEDWQHLEDERLLEVRKQLASNDLLVLRDIPYEALAEGDDVASDSFSVFVSHRRPSDDAAFGSGLGDVVTATIEPQLVQLAEPRGGTFQAKVFLERSRGTGQPANDVVTGEVIFSINLPFAPERLAEANFAVVAPIAACGMDAGPINAAGCHDVDREPIIDATGPH